MCPQGYHATLDRDPTLTVWLTVIHTFVCRLSNDGSAGSKLARPIVNRKWSPSRPKLEAHEENLTRKM